MFLSPKMSHHPSSLTLGYFGKMARGADPRPPPPLPADLLVDFATRRSLTSTSVPFLVSFASTSMSGMRWQCFTASSTCLFFNPAFESAFRAAPSLTRHASTSCGRAWNPDLDSAAAFCSSTPGTDITLGSDMNRPCMTICIRFMACMHVASHPDSAQTSMMA